ncbi:MAG: pilus assembly FimT family protein [Planctomycetota bacterium]|jgi:prepilin-type N-terminal cleavage/methylation domain-containing protein
MSHQSTGFSRRGRAYTLIELLIVVAILGLSGSLLIPYIGNRNSLEVQAAVRMVIGDISFAQSDALAHQEFRRVHFYADGRGYCITRVSDTEIGTAFDPDTADYIVDPFSGAGEPFIVDFVADERFADITVPEVDLDGGGSDLYFDALGGTIMAGSAPGVGGHVHLASSDFTFQLNVLPFTGKMTVEQIP